jgi:uncharacterized protein YndB with AHSA1/START domain
MTTATETATHSVTLTRILNASRERVFAAWTDSSLLAQWFAPAPGFTTTATNDLRRGGDYTIAFRSKEGALHTATGKYMEIVPPERLVFTWRWLENSQADGSIITILLRDLGGKTELTLVHSQLPTAESAKSHEQGWTGCLSNCELFFDPNAQVQFNPTACV